MRGKALFEDFYKVYKGKLTDSKYKYLAYREAEEEHKQIFGCKRYGGYKHFKKAMDRHTPKG